MLSWLDTGSPLACAKEVWVATTQGAITVALVAGIDEATVVEGEIEMNEQFPRSGRGHYHDYRQAPDHLWGFWEIQVSREGEILQHTTYANAKEHKEVVSGFVWTPTGRQHAHAKLFNPTPLGR